MERGGDAGGIGRERGVGLGARGDGDNVVSGQCNGGNRWGFENGGGRICNVGGTAGVREWWRGTGTWAA